MPRAAVVGDQLLPSAIRAIVGSDQGHAGSTPRPRRRHAGAMTETLTYKQLRRSRSDRMVAGVSGGLGRYFDVNPVLYRVGFVVLALLGGAGILIYLAAALVIPDEGQERVDRRAGVARAPQTGRGGCSGSRSSHRLGDRAALAGALLGRAASPGCSCSSPGSSCSPLGPRLWSEITTARARGRGGPAGAPPPAAAAARARSRSRPPCSACSSSRPACSASSPRRASTSRGRSRSRSRAGAVGVAVVVGAFLHLRVGGLVVIGALLGAAAILASTIDLKLDDGVGDRSYAPHDGRRRSTTRTSSASASSSSTSSNLALPPGEHHVITASVGIGHLLVTVPPGVAVHVESHVDWGDSERARERRQRPRRRPHDRPAGAARTRRCSSSTPTSAPARCEVKRAVAMTAMALPRLRQSADERVLAGVCGGIAEAIDVDPTLVRLVFALLALAGGAGIALYVGALALHARAALDRRCCRCCSPASLVLQRARALGSGDPRARADRGRARAALAPRRLAATRRAALARGARR